MRYNSTANPRKAKNVARQMYAQRQVDRWIKWTIDTRGFMFYKDLVNKQKEFNIICYE